MAGWGAAPAAAGWRPSALTPTSIAYNQGISFDPARRDFFFTGVSSLTTSGLYRTNSRLVQTAANVALLPTTREGYNHAGDLSFDPVGRRLLLPLECYYPASGGNTCGTGAIGVADPVSLRFLYYVNLSAGQIQKAMWAEVSPDGRWIWTLSGTHLLVYRAVSINAAAAARQRAGKLGGITATDLGSVLPSAGVTGAAFYQDVFTGAPRLLLVLNQGAYSEVISYATRRMRDGTPTVTGTPTSEITVPHSASDNESEGLAVSGAGVVLNPLGGVLDWQMLPELTPTSFFTRILSYLPTPAPPPDGASMQPRQRLPTALRGLKFHRDLQPLLPEHRDRHDRRPTRGTARTRLGERREQAVSGRDRQAVGRDGPPYAHDRIQEAGSRPTRRTATVALTVIVRSTDTYSRRSATYKLSATPRR